jgi:integrase
MPRAQKSFAALSQADVRALEDKTHAYVHASREPKTNTDRQRFIRYYEEICASREACPWPAEEFNVGCFLVAYCEANQSVQSLNNALSAIRTEARERCGQEFTKPQEWYLRRLRRGLRKTFRRPTERKRPITMDILAQVVLVSDLQKLADLQHLTQGYLQHDACLRTKEAFSLRWSDVSWEVDATGAVQAAGVTIRVSKARYESAAETVQFPPYEIGGVMWCAARFLVAYMEDARVLARQGADEESYLFPSLSGKTGSKRGSRTSFVEWFRARLQQVGYSPDEFAGHSFRAGGATDLHTGQVPEVLGRLLGRWRCREAYFLYLREDPRLQAAQIRAAFEAAWQTVSI